MRYNGINATMQSVVQFGAPATAAVVLTMSKLRTTLLIDIITAVIGISVFCFIPLPKQKKYRKHHLSWRMWELAYDTLIPV